MLHVTCSCEVHDDELNVDFIPLRWQSESQSDYRLQLYCRVEQTKFNHDSDLIMIQFIQFMR